jgi:hypothetical protein
VSIRATPPTLRPPQVLNVFLVSRQLCEEDRFTAHWHYVLDTYPALGQQVVELIAGRAGLPPGRYAGAEDHPFVGQGDLPDFLLRREGGPDILVEHKIGCALGPRQLERYLMRAEEHGQLLALVSRDAVKVPAEVLASPRYIRPRLPDGADRDPAHFRWEDFYPLVAALRGRLGREFREYMDAYGMNPWSWGDWGDPFASAAAAERFRQIWAPLVEFFKQPENRVPHTSCRPDWGSIGCQVRKPMAGIHLFYLTAERSMDDPFGRLRGRVVRCTVYVLREHDSEVRMLPARDEYVETALGPMYVESLNVQKSWGGGDVFAERNYLVSLAALLPKRPDPAEAGRRALEFVQMVRADLQNELRPVQRSRFGEPPLPV